MDFFPAQGPKRQKNKYMGPKICTCTLYVCRNVDLRFKNKYLRCSKNILHSACQPVVNTASGGGERGCE